MTISILYLCYKILSSSFVRLTIFLSLYFLDISVRNLSPHVYRYMEQLLLSLDKFITRSEIEDICST